MERSLRVLFETKDVSQVKSYVQRQFSKILQNRISIQDFIFAKEFRGRQGYKPGACVPALEIAKYELFYPEFSIRIFDYKNKFAIIEYIKERLFQTEKYNVCVSFCGCEGKIFVDGVYI